MKNKHNQQGFSLFMVMIMMIVIALLVVITSQTTSTESRLSANEADRKYALTEAEIGLRSAETFLGGIYTQIKAPNSKVNLQFTADCKSGLCAPVEKVEKKVRDSEKYFEVPDSANGKLTTPAWERKDVFTSDDKSKKSSDGDSNARYIIEYMGQRGGSGYINDYFRVTSRATGKNANTVVTLQSYVEMTRND